MTYNHKLALSVIANSIGVILIVIDSTDWMQAVGFILVGVAPAFMMYIWAKENKKK